MKNIGIIFILFVLVFVFANMTGCASYYAKKHSESGEEYLLSNDKDKAVSEYLKSLEYEDSADTNKKIGDIYKENGDCLSALKYYQKAQTKTELKKESLVLLAECYVKLEMYPEAIENFVQAIELDPEDDAVTLETTEIWNKLEKNKSTIDWIDRIIAAQPKKHYGHAFKGNYFYGAGQVQKAKAEYEKALSIFPRSPSVLLRLGSCLAQLNEYEAAREMYKKSNDLDQSEEAQIQIALTYFMQRNFDKALEISSMIIVKNKTNAQANALVAQILYLQDDYEGAYEYGLIGEKSIKDSAILYKLLGVIATSLKEYPQAIKWFMLHNKIKDDDAEVYFGLGTCYMETGDNLSAIAALNKTIYLDDSLAEAYKKLGILKYKMKDYRDSTYKLQVAVDKLQKDGEAFLYYGMANFERGKEGFDIALEIFKEAQKLLPNDPKPPVYIAAIKANMNEAKSAFENLKKAAALGFDDPAFLDRSCFNEIKRKSAFVRIKEEILDNANNKNMPDLVPLVSP